MLTIDIRMWLGGSSNVSFSNDQIFTFDPWPPSQPQFKKSPNFPGNLEHEFSLKKYYIFSKKFAFLWSIFSRINELLAGGACW